MAGIELIGATVVFMLGTIGLVRGPAREFGVTMALIVLLAFLRQFDTLVEFNAMPAKVNTLMANVGLSTTDVGSQKMMVLLLYSGITILTAFLAYHGQDTLAFRFRDPRHIFGVIFGGAVGAFNGYLIFGTIWYYMHQLGYPIQRYAWFRAEFSPFAQSMISYLPQSLASGLVLSGLALVMLWWRIAR